MERKVKYDYAFKLECVELVLKKGYSAKHVSRIKGLNESNIGKWVMFYEHYGKSGLLPRKNRYYPIGFKQKILEVIEKESLSLRQACVRFNIANWGIIIKWKRDFANFGLDGLKPTPRGKPFFMSNNKIRITKILTREEELLKENEALRCEIEVLKKYYALIQIQEKANRHKS
jgi:transposase